MSEYSSMQYDHDRDFDQIMLFLRDLSHRNPLYGNWFPNRFENLFNSDQQEIQIWKNKDKILAVANSEGPFNYFIQIDPEFAHLENEIIDWICTQSENKYRMSNKNQTLIIHSTPANQLRNAILEKRKFFPQPIQDFIRVYQSPEKKVQFGILSPFQIRTVDPNQDFIRLAKSIRLVFGHGDWFTEEILHKISQCSFYHPDLDLIVEDCEGTIAAFLTVRLDPISNIAELEPLGTLPKYRGLGLAKVLLTEGIHRLEGYNPSLIHIGGAANNNVANHLYDLFGFTLKIADVPWKKIDK